MKTNSLPGRVNGNDSALPIEIKNMAWIKPSLALTAAGYRSFDALGFAPRLNDHAIIKADCDLSLSNKDRSTDEIAYFVEFLRQAGEIQIPTLCHQNDDGSLVVIERQLIATIRKSGRGGRLAATLILTA